jgi:hypothetical protein
VTAQPAVPAGFDPTDPDICLVGIPHEQFLELRRTAPVWWVEQPQESRAGFDGTAGFWAISKHADVAAVSRNSKDFSSQEHGAIIRFAPDMTREQVELQSIMLINQDPPDHTKIRQIISRGFTPLRFPTRPAGLPASTQWRSSSTGAFPARNAFGRSHGRDGTRQTRQPSAAFDRYATTSARRSALRSSSLITATLAAPARQHWGALSSVTPPMATTGREVVRQACASSSSPRASRTPALVGLSNTGPKPR